MAPAKNTSTLLCAGIRASPIETSVVVVRKKPTTGDSNRMVSSKALRASDGSSRTSCHWSGKRAKSCTANPSPLAVVSTPAENMERISEAAVSSGMPSSSAAA